MQERLLRIFRSRDLGWAALAGLTGGAWLLLMARGALQHAPHYDELLHVLAARGWLEFGEPAIADGFYERAPLFTQAVAWCLDRFGDTLAVARLPALVAAALLLLVIGAWVTRKAGLLAGTAAVLSLGAVPATVGLAVFARFYTLHALIAAGIFIAAFEAMQPERRGAVRTAFAAAAILLVPLAWHFQDTTVIAAGGAVAGVLALVVLDRWAAVGAWVRAHPGVTVGGLVAMGGAALFCLWYFDFAERLAAVPLWAEASAGTVQFYLTVFRAEMPLLWPLLPLAAAVALTSPEHRRLALFCAVVAASTLVVHSLAAAKALRYVYYVLPLFGVLWGCGVAALLSRSAASARRAALQPLAILALLCVAFGLSFEGTRAMNLTLGRWAAIELPFADEPDWSPVATGLAGRARDADVVITSNSMKALYYLGTYHYELSATIVPETDSGEEFGIDERTGRRAIGTAASVSEVLGEPGNVLVVLEKAKLGLASSVTLDALAVIENRCGELPLPPAAVVRAWSCAAAGEP